MKIIKKIISALCVASIMSTMFVVSIANAASAPKLIAEVDYDKETGNGTLSVYLDGMTGTSGEYEYINTLAGNITFTDAAFDVTRYSTGKKLKNELVFNPDVENYYEEAADFTNRKYNGAATTGTDKGEVIYGSVYTAAENYIAASTFASKTLLCTFGFTINEEGRKVDQTISIENAEVVVNKLNADDPEDPSTFIEVVEYTAKNGKLDVSEASVTIEGTGSGDDTPSITKVGSYADGENDKAVAYMYETTAVAGNTVTATGTITFADDTTKTATLSKAVNANVEGAVALGIIVQFDGTWKDFVITEMAIN